MANSEKIRPESKDHSLNTLPQTIERIANLINGNVSEREDPRTLWVEGKTRGEAFRKQYEEAALAKSDLERVSKIKKLGEWIKEDEKSSNPLLSQVADACIKLWDKVKSPGHPGHDKRHAMEDLKAGLALRRDLVDSGSTTVGAYQKLALISSMMHDFGRLAEVQATGKVAGADEGREHPKASYYILDSILQHFPQIPQEIRDDLCFAVIVHQDWLSDKNAPNYNLIMNGILERSTASADRQQLLGPEGITRFFQYDVGMSDREIVATTDESRRTKLDPRQKPPLALPNHVEYYMRTHRPTTLPLLPLDEQWPQDLKRLIKEENIAIERANSRITMRTRWLETISGVFLYLGWPHLREEIFAPELEMERRDSQNPGSGQQWRKENEEVYAKNEKNFLHPDTWSMIKQQLQEISQEGTELNKKIKARRGNKSLEQLVKDLVSAPHAAVQNDELANIRKKLSAVTTPDAYEGLATAIAYVLVMRDELAEYHNSVARSIKNNPELYPHQSLERRIVDFVSRR
jgi:hypothetical protein